jgi:hypothetical protein
MTAEQEPATRPLSEIWSVGRLKGFEGRDKLV